MANSRDFTGKNRKFTGVKGVILPKGTTGERASTESGEIRFNTSLQLAEYYDGTAWKSIDAPPTLSGVTGGTGLSADGSTTHTVTINGSNFSVGATVTFIGSTGTLYSATNVNRVSGSQVTCKTTATMGTTDDPYSVRLTNTSGLSFTLADVITFNAVPNAGSNFIGSIWTGRVVSGSSLNASTTDPEGDAITYSVVPGYALPSGLSISSSTGYITGTVGITVTEGFNYVFKIRASTSSGSRDYQCFITGASATITATVLMVGGGGGATNYSGGAGAGEVISITRGLARGTTFPLVIGGGGPGGNPSSRAGIDGAGTTTTGFSETVKRGGGGHGSDGSQSPSAQIANGEGGGSRSGGASGTQGTSVGTGVTRYGGYSGGTGSCNAYYPGAGGGGAGAGGSPASPNTAPAGAGGSGVEINITGTPYYWGGGGGGASHTSGSGGAGGAGGGGGGGSQGGSAGTGGSGLNSGQNGVGPGSPHKGGNGGENTGGGGAAGPGNAESIGQNAGNGGSGIVIVRYAGATTVATGGTVTSYSQGGTTYQVHTFTTSSNFITD